MKVEAAVLGSPSLISHNYVASVDVKQHDRKTNERSKEPRRDQKREVELDSHSELDCLLLQVSTAGHCCDCSAQLLKNQIAEFTSCFALAGSPPP